MPAARPSTETFGTVADPATLRRLTAALRRWYRRHRRDLPWRRTRDPYAIWVSEIMLQQTRVDTVIDYYRRFLAAFPAVDSLAKADSHRVLKLWEGLGYYSRARNLQRGAREVMLRHAGKLPRTVNELIALPGIGRYTAGAIASIAFDVAAPLVDGNVKRVFARLFRIEQAVDSAAANDRFWTIAEAMVPRRAPGDFNQALMELGATVCVPRNPRCEICPVRGDCRAFAAGVQGELPRKTRAAKAPHKRIVVAAIHRDGKYLIGRRPENGFLGGLWEFPGGKIEAGESPAQALRREIAEEVGLQVVVGKRLAIVKHAYSHFTVALHVYHCEAPRGRPRKQAHTALQWVAPARFDRYAFPTANHKFLPLLRTASDNS